MSHLPPQKLKINLGLQKEHYQVDKINIYEGTTKHQNRKTITTGRRLVIRTTDEGGLTKTCWRLRALPEMAVRTPQTLESKFCRGWEAILEATERTNSRGLNGLLERVSSTELRGGG